MDGLPRIGTLVLIAGLLGACSSLIGLDKFDSHEPESAGEGGDSGHSGKGGKGGSGGGSGGTSGSATMTGGAAGMSGAGGVSGKGGSAGKGGQNTSGDSGNGGVGDEGGMGPVGGKGGKGGKGGQAGTGGISGTGGDVGTGGELGCSEVIEITATGAYSESADGSFATYSYDLSPQIYGPDPDFGALPDYLWLDFYAGAEYTGDLVGQSFSLGVGEEENYASCSRCVWLGVDFGYATDPPDCSATPDDCKTLSAQYFFATSGTLEIAANSDQMNGYPNATLTDVTLSEVTINFDASGLSKIVPGGRCLHLTTASYTTDLPPVEWECAAYAYGSGDGCDCGCGIIDPDCAGETGVGACEYCSSGGTCSLDYMCHGVDLYDNSICTGVQPWTCDPRHFGDPYGNCDCGCGIQDPDCASLDASACTYCDDPDSCTAAATGTCADLLPADNTTCQ
jgi:hypothetical protein